jgi:hypothetical protein
MKGAPFRPRDSSKPSAWAFCREALGLRRRFGRGTEAGRLPQLSVANGIRHAGGKTWARRSDRIAAVPGRMNEIWFKAEREGVSYGQCSKLRGKDYSNMPIAFRGVSEESYAAWLAEERRTPRQTPRQAISRP